MSIGGIVSMNTKTAEQYYNSLNLSKYNFTLEEKQAICKYYDYFKDSNLPDNGTHVTSVPEENFEEMMGYMKEYYPDSCVLWGDGNSNWACVYYQGSLRGKVAFLSHEEGGMYPLFRNMSSFVDRVIQNNKDGVLTCFLHPSLNEVPYNYDYPNKNPTELEKSQNLKIVEALQAQLPSLLEESDEAHHQAVMSICQLIPPENLDLLIPFINCGNMYVEQDIPYIFAFHNYREALPALEDAAENGSVHVKNSARRAVSLHI